MKKIITEYLIFRLGHFKNTTNPTLTWESQLLMISNHGDFTNLVWYHYYITKTIIKANLSTIRKRYVVFLPAVAWIIHDLSIFLVAFSVVREEYLLSLLTLFNGLFLGFFLLENSKKRKQNLNGCDTFTLLLENTLRYIFEYYCCNVK